MSNEREVTIKMPKKHLRKWLKALRSDRYVQAREVLYDPKTGGFCCLGLLQYCVSGGEVEVNAGDEFMATPSKEWLDENGITFSGIVNRNPDLPSFGISAAEANDEGNSFEAIADAIEACAEGY